MRDAILIPGGGVRPGGQLPVWAQRRFELALEAERGEYLICLSAGTPHRLPPLDEHGFPIMEAHAGARWLLAHGIPRERILIENASFDTIGNAYFSRVIHAIPRGFRELLVITSAFHMPRAEAAFRWIYRLEGPGHGCKLDFAESPNDGIEPFALAARIEKERVALASLEALRPRWRTLAEFHGWMFGEHAAYCAGTPAFGPPSAVAGHTY